MRTFLCLRRATVEVWPICREEFGFDPDRTFFEENLRPEYSSVDIDYFWERREPRFRLQAIKKNGRRLEPLWGNDRDFVVKDHGAFSIWTPEDFHQSFSDLDGLKKLTELNPQAPPAFSD